MAANERFFADPRSRQAALGLQTGKGALWLDPSGKQTLALQNGGILDPQRFDIKPGTAIFSFTTVTTELKWMIGREWWVARTELDQIIRFAEVNNVSMGRAVRLLCCVPPEWGNNTRSPIY